MLTVAESSFLFQYLSFFSSVYIFPFDVDKKRGELKQFGGVKYLIWNLLLLLQSLHYAHGLVQFLLLLTVRRDQIMLYHLPAQFDGMIIPLLVYPAIIPVFQSGGDMLVKVFNELYDCADGTETRRSLWKLSLQELLALGFCVIVIGGIVFYGGMVILFHDMAHLLINNAILLPMKSSALAVIIVTMLEMWSVSMWLVNVGFFMSLNALVLSKMEQTRTKIQKILRYGHYYIDQNDFFHDIVYHRCRERNKGSFGEIPLRQAYHSAIHVQLFIQLFNNINSWFLHGIKMTLISTAILHGYVGIRFGHTCVWIGGFCAFIHVCSFVAYCGAFQRAHQLIEMQREVKQELLVACDKCRRRNVRTEIQKALKALRCTGMRVGSFHEMERNSALVFADFVERQIVGLLVTF